LYSTAPGGGWLHAASFRQGITFPFAVGVYTSYKQSAISGAVCRTTLSLSSFWRLTVFPHPKLANSLNKRVGGNEV